ncbi:MAG: hypothetical protein GX075_08435 [Firmicutes bacterium]|nr:hypothetical protein [Bacillota bacterium]
MTCFNIFSVILALMAGVAAGQGIYHPEVYSAVESDYLKLVSNQDFTVLVIFVPLLLTSTWLAAQRQYRGTLVWLGAVGFLSYVYTGYALAGVSERLFLLHSAIASLSYFLLLIRLAVIDHEEIRLRFTPVASYAFTASFLLVAAFLIVALWLPKLAPSFSNKTMLEMALLKTKAVFAIRVLDIVFLGPLCCLTGIWLFGRKAAGYILTTMLLIIAAAKFGTMLNDWHSLHIYPNSLFAGLTLVSLVSTVRFLKKLREERLTSYHDRISKSC